MKKVLTLLALSGTLVFTACKKETSDPPPAAPSCTLSKITYPDNSSSVIERNSSGKYLKVKNYSGGSLSSYADYVYSGDMLTKMAVFNGANQLQYYLTYEKTSYGQLVHYMIPSGGIFIEQGQFEYHMNGARITQVITKAPAGSSFTPIKEDSYTFNGSGNVTQLVSNDLQQSKTITYTYTYDSKKKPYNGDFGPDPALQSTNNIQGYSATNGASETYAYTYNSNNYALTKSTVGNGKSTYTFQYTGCN
jgi:hypothetical protein